MVGLSLARFPVVSHRDWTYNNSSKFMPPAQETAASLSDMIFGFLEEGDLGLPESVSSEEGSSEMENLEMEEERENNGNNAEEDKSFWENQHQLLQVINFFFLCLCNKLAVICNPTLQYSFKARNLKLLGTVLNEILS